MPATFPDIAPLVNNFIQLLLAHQNAFKQHRTLRRVMALACVKVLAFNRHTITQLLVVLGLVTSDWSSWYRLIKKRIDMLALSGALFKHTLEHSVPNRPYVIDADGTQMPRTGQKK